MAKEVLRKLDTRVDAYLVDLSIETDRVMVNVTFEVGAVNDPKGKQGISHLLEHYIIALIDQASGYGFDINGWTKKESTDYYLDSNKGSLETELEEFLKTLVRPEFDNEQVLEREKIALINEQQEKINSGEARARQAFEGLIIEANCSYTKTFEEEIRAVKKIGLDDLKSFFENELSKKRCLVLVGGHDIDEKTIEQIEKTLDKYLDPGKESGEFKKCQITKKSHLEKSLEGIAGSYVRFSFPSPSLEDDLKNRTATNLVTDLFTHPKYGTLFRELREKGIYDIDTFSHLYREFGFSGFVAHVPAGSVKTLIEVLKPSLGSLSEVGFDEKALTERIKRLKEGDQDRWGSNGGRFDWVLGDLVYEGRLYSPEDISKILDNITVKDLEEVTNEVFDLDKMITTVVGEMPVGH